MADSSETITSLGRALSPGIAAVLKDLRKYVAVHDDMRASNLCGWNYDFPVSVDRMKSWVRLLENEDACTNCRGTGKVCVTTDMDEHKYFPCPHCKGTGQWRSC